MRALALSALAPRAGERLWDIGAGSGSISVEWALCGGMADAIEAREDRAAHIRANARSFGVAHKIDVRIGRAPAALSGLAPPQAVFFGGGLDGAMFDAVCALVPKATRMVAHAVTLETEAMLVRVAAPSRRRFDAGRDRACGAARDFSVLGGSAAGRAMERGHMRVAGLGFRQGVKVTSLREALDAAGGHHGLTALATVGDKADTGALVALASELGLPIKMIPADVLRGIETATRSDMIAAKFGVGSVAEAVALIAAGRNARLVAVRVVSRDRTATAAIAEGEGP